MIEATEELAAEISGEACTWARWNGMSKEELLEEINSYEPQNRVSGLRIVKFVVYKFRLSHGEVLEECRKLREKN